MIPRVIHRCWIGGEEPEWLRPFADTWRRSGWTMKEWNDENVRDELFPLRNQTIYDDAPSLDESVGQLRSDVLRYEILQRYGGLWVDADFECLRPVDALIDGHDCFAAWEEQDKWIANGFLGGVAGHPFLDRLVEGLAANVYRYVSFRPNRMSGPHYITRLYHENPGELHALDQRHFYPYLYSDLRIGGPGPGSQWPPETYAVHHWRNQREARGVPA